MINLYPNPNEKREHYYVFLDIDGTLIDEEYGKRVRGPFFSFGQNSVLKPESIEALNILLASLNKNMTHHLLSHLAEDKIFLHVLNTCMKKGLFMTNGSHAFLLNQADADKKLSTI